MMLKGLTTSHTIRRPASRRACCGVFLGLNSCPNSTPSLQAKRLRGIGSIASLRSEGVGSSDYLSHS